MDHTLTLIILMTALIALFIEELSLGAKRFWKNKCLRHGGLMMFIGFVGFGYYSIVNALLLACLKSILKAALFIAPYVPFVESKLMISYVFLQCFLSSTFVGVFVLIYYVKYKCFYKHSPEILWSVWFIITSMYFTS